MATMKGGDKLAQALAEMARKLDKAGMLRVGFLEDAKYPDGTSVAMVAAIQNFGAPSRGIPPRPFFSNLIANKRDEWPAAISLQLKKNDYDVGSTLQVAGAAIAGQLQAEIVALMAPALSPITVMLRGMKLNDSELKVSGSTVGEAAARVRAGKTNYGASTKPLVDTGHMLDSVGFEVKS